MATQLRKPKFIQLLASIMMIFSLSVSSVQANPLGQIPQIPQIPAFLPMSMDVPMTEKLAVDGEWMISNIKKRIRIEGGRAYAIDSWLHLFVLKIDPLMVVSKNWRRTGPGEYTGEDLPLMGSFTAKLGRDGHLLVDVAGALGPVKLTLVPIRMDDQRRFDRAKAGKSDRRPPPRPSEYDDYSEDYPQEYAEEGYEEDYYEEESDYYDEGYGEEGGYEEEYVEEDYEYSEEEYYDEGEEYAGEDEEYYEEEEYVEEAPRKVKAKTLKRAKKGCKGKQIYLSKGACYSCPEGFKRFSPTRKMTHPEACVKRGLGINKPKVKGKYRWQANGCPKYQFKHKGMCKKCPKGTKRIHVAGLDTGYCRVL